MAKDGEAETVIVEDEGPNPADIGAWAASLSKDTGTPDVIIPEPDEKLDPPDDKKGEADKTAEQDATQATEGRKVLKAKDGVHEIPYARLEESNAARDKAVAEAAEAKAQAEATAKQLAEAQAKLDALEKGADKGTTTAAEAGKSADELEAQLKALEDEAETAREESPWMADQLQGQAKVMRAILAQTRAVEQELSQERKKEQETQQEAVQREVNTALDAVPAIRYWEKEKPAFYNEAIRIDMDLRAKPEWQNKPFKDRFEAVQAEVVKIYGESILPPGSKPASTPAVPKKELPKDETAGVASLTDIPGGTPTAQNPLEAVENADPTMLANALIKMDDPAAILRWVNS